MNAEEIKGLRKKLKMTQEAFAHTVGVSLHTLNRWERGYTKPQRLAQEKLRAIEHARLSNG